MEINVLLSNRIKILNKYDHKFEYIRSNTQTSYIQYTHTYMRVTFIHI